MIFAPNQRSGASATAGAGVGAAVTFRPFFPAAMEAVAAATISGENTDTGASTALSAA